jgi:tripartite ATP-independent transporter DctP family solute receptor
MKRVCAIVAVLAVALACIACSRSSGATTAGSDGDAAKEMTLKLGHVLETSHHNHQAALYFADSVDRVTGGNVKIQVYPASQLGDEGSQDSAMVMGAQELGLFGSGEAAKRDLALSIFDSAYIFKDRDHLVKVMSGEIFKEISEQAASRSGIRFLAGTYFGTRHISNSIRPVTKIEDIRNLKIRCPDQEVFLTVISALGAQPSPLALSELYLALQQGVIDGMENPFSLYQAMKFYEVQKYMTTTGHIVNADFFMASEKWFSGAAAELRKIIQDSAAAAAAYANKISFETEDKARSFLEEQGMQIVDLSPGELAKFVAAGQATHPSMIEAWGGKERYNAILALGK